MLLCVCTTSKRAGLNVKKTFLFGCNEENTLTRCQRCFIFFLLVMVVYLLKPIIAVLSQICHVCVFMFFVVSV